MKKIFINLLSIVAATSILVGCTTVPTETQQARIESGVKVAAQVGTQIVLMEKPELKSGFVKASADLKVLAVSTNAIGIQDVLAVVQRLDVKELKSPRAALYITSGVLLINELGVPQTIPLEQSQSIRGVAKALSDGIDFALATLPVEPPAPKFTPIIVVPEPTNTVVVPAP